MTRLVWGEPTARQYENGISNGMFITDAQWQCSPWNGLVSVEEQPLGGDPVSYYLDGEKFAMISQYEEFAGTVNVLTIPKEFRGAIGEAEILPGLFASQQKKQKFNFAYKTQVGDASNPKVGEQIHLCYNLMVMTPKRTHQTLRDDTEMEEISLEFRSKAIRLAGVRNVAHLILDSRYMTTTQYAALDAIIFGSAEFNPSFPQPATVKAYMNIYT